MASRARPPEAVRYLPTSRLADRPAQGRASRTVVADESMKESEETCAEVGIAPEHPSTKGQVTFTEETTTSLFDDLYHATWIEGCAREKPFFKGKGDAKKEVPAVRRTTFTKTDKKGNEKTIEGYVYLELTPALATLRQYLPAQGEWVRSRYRSGK